MRLPSKKVVPIYAACIIALSGIIFAVVYVPKKNIQQPATLAAIVDNSYKPTIDVENSQYKNWEQTITSVVTKNGVQINPTSDTTQTPGEDPLNRSTTRQLARDVFSSFIKLQQSGKEITAADQEEIIQDALLSSDLQGTAPIAKGKIYTEYDIKVSKNTSPEALRAYGNAVGAIIVRNSMRSSQNEIAILENAVDTQNRADLKKIDQFIAAYNNTVSSLLTTPVPEPLVQFHLSLMNEVSRVIAIDENMKKMFDDPVATLVAVKEYQEGIMSAAEVIEAGRVFFRGNKIVFSRNESGYVFAYAS